MSVCGKTANVMETAPWTVSVKRYLTLQKTQTLPGKNSNRIVTNHNIMLVAKKQSWFICQML